VCERRTFGGNNFLILLFIVVFANHRGFLVKKAAFAQQATDTMLPHATETSCIPQDAVTYLSKSLDVCDRLQSWADKPGDRPSALVDLGKSHVAKLVTKARPILEKILYDETRWILDDGREQSFWELRSLWQGITDVVFLRQLCDHHELYGQEGELNALFYARFLLENTNDASVETWQDKARAVRIQGRFCKLLDGWAPSDPQMDKFW